MTTWNRDKMPDFAFRAMAAVMAIEDWLFPRLDKRVAGFGIRKGMTLVDYGCGPGRYTVRFAKLVGQEGKVYAVDVQELALDYVKRRASSEGVENVIPILASGYRTGIPNHTADMVFALDMFFGVGDPAAMLAEVNRITRPDGVLVLDDGHKSRSSTLQKVARCGKWDIKEASQDHLRCIPK